jgi:predicted metal-dependent TIM-barrel fold hydrolase
MHGFGVTSGMGDVSVIATQGRGLSADELADMALAKIMSVSDTAPEPIKAQADVFKARIRAVMIHYIRQAKKSGLTDVYNVLRDHGQHDAADIVRKLNQEG